MTARARMNEDRVTDLFLDAVRRLSPRGVSALLRDALGIAEVPEASAWTTLGRTHWQDFTAPRQASGSVPTVLVGLTATAEVVDGAPRDSTASIVDGVVAARGEIVVLLEAKLTPELAKRLGSGEQVATARRIEA